MAPRVDTHWTVDEHGHEVMPPLVSEFLDWLLTDPRQPSSQYAWAAEHGLHDDTPRRWKNDKRFIREWERRARELDISIDRVQQVVNQLFRNAITSDNAKDQLAYLQYVDRFTPRQILLVEGDETKGMSDEALAAELAATLPELRAELAE
jgi:hypothetical protein